MRVHVRVLFMLVKNPVLKHFTVLGKGSHLTSAVKKRCITQLHLNTFALAFFPNLKHHSVTALEQYSTVIKGFLMIYKVSIS